MANKLQTIGSKTLVDLPQYSVNGIPAKIDTGADYSSIWASNIKERGGTLSFTLFDKSSRYYTGKAIKTTDYTIALVRNSFGDSELRHKVRLSVVINGVRIRARFNLSDRSKNHYPILIGKGTLRGKFLVDVTKDRLKDNHSLLVLTARPDKDKTKFFKDINKNLDRADITFATFDDLDFYVHQGNSRIVLSKTKKDIDSFDLVYFKDYLEAHEIAVAVAYYLDMREVKYIDASALDFSLNNKLFQYIVLADNNIAIPNSIYKPKTRLKKSYKELKDKFGPVFILKDIFGLRGRNNHIIKDKKSFEDAFKNSDDKVAFIAQEFIPTEDYYRLLILGNHIKLIIKRKRKKVTLYFGNKYDGPEPELLKERDVPYLVKNQSMQAAVLLKRNVAGVDWVKDNETNSWYCLEVNASPQLASGIYLDEKKQVFAEYLNDLITK